MAKFVVVDTGHLFDSLLEKSGIDPRYVSRLILDLKVREPGRLYLEMFADDEVLSVDLPDGFQLTMVERDE